jgi:hypothetical protein
MQATMQGRHGSRLLAETYMHARVRVTGRGAQHTMLARLTVLYFTQLPHLLLHPAVVHCQPPSAPVLHIGRVQRIV